MLRRLSRSLRARLTLMLSLLLVLSSAAMVIVIYLVADHAVFEASALDDQDLAGIQAVQATGDATHDPCVADEDALCLWVDSEGDELTALSVVTFEAKLRMATATVSALAGRSALVALVVVAIAVVLTWALLRRSFRRMEEATRTARLIDEAHPDLRLRIDGPRDEVRELGDTVDAVLDHLADALTAQRLFVANASHELRTPLTTTRTALDIPLAQGRVPADLVPAVQRALDANERATELLDALLLLARTGAGGDPAERADHVDLALAVREVLAERAPDRAVHLDLDPAIVLADPTMLQQVLTNLIRNADQHNRPDGAIWIRTRTEDGRGILEVDNDGAPIAEDDVPALREPFHRGPESRLSRGDGAGGMGLGLAIVDAVARRHGGRLVLHARPGGGLRARIELPASAPDPDPDD